LTLRVMRVTGEKAQKAADALTSTTFRMLQLLAKERLSISAIAERLGLSQAYVSEQIQLLHELGMIKVNYETGKRGISKLCELAVKEVTIVIAPEG
jgi:predicted transcriptional regulator